MTDRTVCFVVTAHTSVRSRPYATAPIIRAAKVDERLPGGVVEGRGYQGTSDWARVILPTGVIGYIWGGAGHWEAL